LSYQDDQAELALKFAFIPDETPVQLTKGDVQLLLESMQELHESFAAWQQLPFLMGRGDGNTQEIGEASEAHAQKSFQLYARLSDQIMRRLVDGGFK